MKDQIGFCGIWCGSCVAGNGATSELARKFQEAAKKHNLEKWAPKDFNFKEFEKGLSSIQRMHTCPGCRKGGGLSTCAVRICALKRGFDDCSKCGGLIECRNFEHLEKENPKIKEKLLETKNMDRKELLRKWMSELRTKWPHCIVICESAKSSKP